MRNNRKTTSFSALIKLEATKKPTQTNPLPYCNQTILFFLLLRCFVSCHTRDEDTGSIVDLYIYIQNIYVARALSIMCVNYVNIHGVPENGGFFLFGGKLKQRERFKWTRYMGGLRTSSDSRESKAHRCRRGRRLATCRRYKLHDMK